MGGKGRGRGEEEEKKNEIHEESVNKKKDGRLKSKRGGREKGLKKQ